MPENFWKGAKWAVVLSVPLWAAVIYIAGWGMGLW